MSIDHCGLYIFMTKQFLDGANVVAVLEQMSCKGMAEGGRLTGLSILASPAAWPTAFSRKLGLAWWRMVFFGAKRVVFYADGVSHLIEQFSRWFFVQPVDLMTNWAIIYSSYFNLSPPNVLNDLGD